MNGSAYPSHFISGETLASERTTLTFRMSGTPSRIGRMYVTGTNGEILSASTDNRTYLRFRNDPLGGTSQAAVYAAKAPVAVSVNGEALPPARGHMTPASRSSCWRTCRRARCWCGSAGTDRLPRSGRKNQDLYPERTRGDSLAALVLPAGQPAGSTWPRIPASRPVSRPFVS